MNIWVQNGYKCISYLPSWSCGWLGAVAHCPSQHHKRVSYHTFIVGKRSKFKVWILLNAWHFHTIVKSKIVSWTTRDCLCLPLSMRSILSFALVLLFSTLSFQYEEFPLAFPVRQISFSFYLSEKVFLFHF